MKDSDKAALLTTGKRIKDLRLAKGLSQAGLAEKLDVSTNTVARLERGEHEISRGTTAKLAKLFGVTATDILGF